MSIARSVLSALAALALAGACGHEEPAASRRPLEVAPAQDTPPTAPSGAATPGAEGELLLDRRGDGAALLGRAEPAPPNADPDRVVTLRVSGLAGPVAAALDGARAIDARFAEGAIVVLGTDHVLTAYPEDGGAPVALDERAEHPLSVRGAQVAYVRGEMPDFEVALADLRTGAVVAITQGMAPAWSPALSPDGREIAFVSGRDGSPRLYRIAIGAGPSQPRALPLAERFPTSPRAPRWEGSVLSFEDELGAAAVDLETGAIVEGGAR